ncbi:MAG: PQQ-binding-like beta-propeller repeat protein [Ignavibacteriaceae bacterium]|nr:PQQ-binding-like beta-propeller repeat protein [Ignavibacteriaceae bacterium]
MKFLLSILFLSIQFVSAQVTQIAVITNPEIGPQSNALNLIEVVEDINMRQNITQVVVLGNITANGKFDEFIWAQEILDELTAPYFVVGGEKDYFLSEGKGSEVTLLWSDDKQMVVDKNFSLIGINTLLSTFNTKKYIDIETLTWLDEKLNRLQVSRMFTFSYHVLQSTENSFRFFEKMLDKKVFSFVGIEDKSFANKSIFEGLYLNRKDGWGYLMVSTNRDSIHIKKILSEEIKKKVKPEIVRSIFSKPLVRELKEPVQFVAAGSKIWSFEKNKTTITSSVYNSEKIFSVSRNGLVLCLDLTGKEKWRFDTNERINSPPIIENDLLVLASDDGDIITLNSNNGSANQIIGIGEEITSGISVIDVQDQGTTSKAVIAGTVYGNLYCYDLLTLDPLWTQHLSLGSSESSIVSSIVHSDNKIFLVDDVGTLYCFSAVNGMLIWNLEASKGGWRSSVEVLFSQKASEKNIYLIDTAGNLFCIDALLGTAKWNVKYISANGLIRLNNKQELVLPTKNNKVVIVSPKLGKVVSEIELPLETSAEAITDVLVIDDRMIVGFSDGRVYKIQAKQKAVKIFRGGLAPLISLTNVDGNCLVTDYDGRFTLLTLTP